jgi:hypothetical protein
MGLDWDPLGKPKPGHEPEFGELFEELILSESGDKSLWARWYEITIDPTETLQAPRIGFDARADAWIAERYPGRSLRRPFLTRAKFVKNFHGIHVLELMEPNDGLPFYSNGFFGGRVDCNSFRGQILRECQDVLEDELITEAWGHYLANELAAYGAKLRDRAAAFAEKNNLRDVIDRREPPEGIDELDHPAMQAHIVSAAAKWCHFWSERGHGMRADF